MDEPHWTRPQRQYQETLCPVSVPGLRGKSPILLRNDLLPAFTIQDVSHITTLKAGTIDGDDDLNETKREKKMFHLIPLPRSSFTNTDMQTQATTAAVDDEEE